MSCGNYKIPSESKCFDSFESAIKKVYIKIGDIHFENGIPVRMKRKYGKYKRHIYMDAEFKDHHVGIGEIIFPKAIAE